MLSSIKGTVKAIEANILEVVRVMISEGLVKDLRLGDMNSATAETGAGEDKDGENRT